MLEPVSHAADCVCETVSCLLHQIRRRRKTCTAKAWRKSAYTVSAVQADRQKWAEPGMFDNVTSTHTGNSLPVFGILCLASEAYDNATHAPWNLAGTSHNQGCCHQIRLRLWCGLLRRSGNSQPNPDPRPARVAAAQKVKSQRYRYLHRGFVPVKC